MLEKHKNPLVRCEPSAINIALLRKKDGHEFSTCLQVFPFGGTTSSHWFPGTEKLKVLWQDSDKGSYLHYQLHRSRHPGHKWRKMQVREVSRNKQKNLAERVLKSWEN